MKNLFALFLSGILLTVIGCGNGHNDKPANENPSKYDFESVDGDPTNTQIYTLKNGLKVYMSVNKDEPRVQTAIAVRAGSKNDPSDATGLAHYLEHMLFKGNSEIASLNWEKEKVLLQQISDLYEKHRETTDEAERTIIYGQIDSLSNEAAKYVATNEYDKMISSLGAKRTNAFTSTERTVYINDIPANEIEKWMKVEGNRFRELTLRLFHTELETVYEEFNRGQDNDYSKTFHEIGKLLYQKHPYGTQTTIGTGEHLKNPSMVKIHEYFDTYYVPNNIAICLSGDIDPEATVELIEKYFGDWERKEVPEFTFVPEEPIAEPRTSEIFGPMGEWVVLGYRFGGVHSDDAKYVTLASDILNNGQAGLIDLNLVQQQKVLSAWAWGDVNHDYSDFALSANPRQGQSLEEVQELLLEQVEKLKSGDFPDWMIESVVRNLKKDQSMGLESNWSRAYKMVNAFIMRKEWSETVDDIDEIAAITKEELSAWATKNMDNNHVAVFKRNGEDPNIHKVQKPKITPLEINRDTNSAFFEEFKKTEENRLDPVFLDYKTAITHGSLKGKVPVQYIKNELNDIFRMYYVLDMGTDNLPELDLALKFLPYLGTSDYSPEELQQEFYKLGLSYDIFSQRDRVYVYLQGLEESLDEGTKLFEHVLANVEPNANKLKEVISDIMKERSDAKKSKGQIMFNGMRSYAKYGMENPFNTGLTEEEMLAIDPTKLTDILHSFTTYKHRVFYYGNKPMDDVTAVLDKYHDVPETLADYPASREYPELEINENKVYLVDYDMVQTEMMLIGRDEMFNKELIPYANLFGEYFGSGLSSIIFQEIREGKALAYSAYASFGQPDKMDESHYVTAYVGTQVDKLGEAVDAMLQLMNEMPEANDQFEGARLAALKKLETDRITRGSIFWSYETATDRGLDYDIRQDIYEKLKTMDIAELKQFFDTHIAGKKYNFLVIGKKDEMDFETLSKLGPVQELPLEQLFGF